MGVGGSTETVLAAPGRGTVDGDVVCFTLFIRLYIPVDDFIRVYDEPRISHARVCLYFGNSVVYLRRILAEGSNSAILESGRLSFPVYTGNTRVYPDQYVGSDVERSSP